MNELHSELKETLKRVEIRDPIKSLFNPVFDIIPTPNSSTPFRISIRIDVQSATIYQFINGLECSSDITEYEARRYQRQPERLGKRILELLVEYMRHEVEESLYFDNEYVTTPKHWGPSNADFEEIRKGL